MKAAIIFSIFSIGLMVNSKWMKLKSNSDAGTFMERWNAAKICKGIVCHNGTLGNPVYFREQRGYSAQECGKEPPDLEEIYYFLHEVGSTIFAKDGLICHNMPIEGNNTVSACNSQGIKYNRMLTARNAKASCVSLIYKIPDEEINSFQDSMYEHTWQTAESCSVVFCFENGQFRYSREYREGVVEECGNKLNLTDFKEVSGNEINPHRNELSCYAVNDASIAHCESIRSSSRPPYIASICKYWWQSLPTRYE